MPLELQRFNHWVTWRPEDREGRKSAKVPYGVDGRMAKANDPGTWLSFEDACARYETGEWAGIGFYFWRVDPFVGVDLDNCRDPETGVLEPWAADVVASLDSYTEASQSGRGVHIVCMGNLRFQDGREGGKRGNVEVYAGKHYLALTGHVIEGKTAVNKRTERLEALCADLRLLDEGTQDGPPEPKSEEPKAMAEGRIPDRAKLTDEEVLDRVVAGADGPAFHRLWTGEARPGRSGSEADYELLTILCRVSDDDDQVERLMWESPLKRDKWKAKRGAVTYIRYSMGMVRRRVAAVRGVKPGAAASRIMTLEEMMKGDLRPPVPTVAGLAWAGRVVLFASREKIGKSTLLSAGVAALSRGAPFLGEPTRGPARTLWVSSDYEAEADVALRLVRFGAAPKLVHVLYPSGLDDLDARVREVQPQWIIIDTLWALLSASIDDPASAAGWMEHMQRFITWARAGAAVTVAHHTVKSGKEYRDSTAIGGAVDAILTYYRPEQSAATVRRLEAVGRWGIKDLTLDLKGDAYEVTEHGTMGADEKLSAMKANILNYLEDHPGVGQATLEAAVGGSKPIIRDALQTLVDQGLVENKGSAAKCKWQVRHDAASAPAADRAFDREI